MRTILTLTAMLLIAPLVSASACDISCKIEKALKGDGAAAFEVAQESRVTQTPEIVAHWLQISAENGNAAGQWEYGLSLVENSKSRYDCIRTIYWFRQAGQNGNAAAATALGKVEYFLETHPEPIMEGCRDAL
ncbi:hypothetical protein [Lysobacter niastensis]|uniref:Sel1 repeat family protein n=1 Tax=Lysobacter niastensis TaxID=380629 RepID=A0ABS0B593_9GAMM|nr:hypothetical protein [Lysobacter niastensis]MBF6023965.1 hypothetical protein [Lysobacter niastensis]